MSDSTYDAIPDFGLLYDSVPLYAARPDVDFYVEEAKAAGGPALEIGCGTGRILIPTARAGVTITGLDGSTEMLARARAKLAAEPAPVRQRATLVQADMRDFELGARFALITAPFRVVRSEEHTSELQSHSFISYAVFCLNKKKTSPRQRRQTRPPGDHPCVRTPAAD